MANALRELDEIDAVFGALAHAARRHILIVLNARGGRVSARRRVMAAAMAWACAESGVTGSGPGGVA